MVMTDAGRTWQRLSSCGSETGQSQAHVAGANIGTMS